MSKIAHWLTRVLGIGRLVSGDWLPARGCGADPGRISVMSIPPAASRARRSSQAGRTGLDDVNQVLVTGTGVSAKVVEYCRKLSPQEIDVACREQLNEI